MRPHDPELRFYQPTYASQKVDKGIWLQLSDDQQSVLRLTSYRETGDLSIRQEGGGERVVKGTFWQVEELCSAPRFYVTWNEDGTLHSMRKMVAAPYDWFVEAGHEADFEHIDFTTVATGFQSKREAQKYAGRYERAYR